VLADREDRDRGAEIHRRAALRTIENTRGHSPCLASYEQDAKSGYAQLLLGVRFLRLGRVLELIELDVVVR
jgi:hypothetical protein